VTTRCPLQDGGRACESAAVCISICRPTCAQSIVISTYKYLCAYGFLHTTWWQHTNCLAVNYRLEGQRTTKRKLRAQKVIHVA